MDSRTDNSSRPAPTAAERSVLEAELAEHRKREQVEQPPDCLRWLQRQALMLDPRADRGEFLDLISDAMERFKEQRA